MRVRSIVPASCAASSLNASRRASTASSIGRRPLTSASLRNAMPAGKASGASGGATGGLFLLLLGGLGPVARGTLGGLLCLSRACRLFERGLALGFALLLMLDNLLALARLED